MAQEFTINSSAIESKINQLLPSQGGFGAGIDFSASTMVIPIVDLTESAEGSSVRQDLQTALSLTSVTAHAVANTTTTIINTTGYYKIFGVNSLFLESGGTGGRFQLTDGTTTKIISKYDSITGGAENLQITNYDFIVFLKAGESLQIVSDDIYTSFNGCSRQIADLDGNLVSPL